MTFISHNMATIFSYQVSKLSTRASVTKQHRLVPA